MVYKNIGIMYRSRENMDAFYNHVPIINQITDAWKY